MLILDRPNVPLINGCEMVPDCKCNKPPFYFEDYKTKDLGEDSHFAVVTIDTCKKCGTKWVNYLIEEEFRTKAGRWWRAPLDATYMNKLKAANAKDYLESLEWCFVGGPFYNGKIYRHEEHEGPIKII